MPENWKTYTLGEIATLQRGFDLPTKKRVSGNIPIVAASGIGGYHNQSKVKGPGVITGRSGTIGKVMFQEGDFWPLNTSLWVKDFHGNDVKFIYYLLSNFDFSGFNNGTSVPTLNRNDVHSIEFNIPELPEQKSIASILSALDDKIELNLQMNKTLEEMAMASYKHWFVDFGPFQDGEFVDSDLGEIPKGWEVKQLKDFALLIMGQSPKSEFYNDNKEGLPFHQGVKDYGTRFPTDITYSTAGNREAAKGDILFSVRAPVGRLNVAKNKIILGRGLAAMRMPKFTSFLFYALKRMFTTEDSIGSGTVFNSVNKSDLQNLKFVLPPEEQLLKFTYLVDPLDLQYLNNSIENQTLTQLRDTLLPKLISGEVRVKDAEKTLSAVL